MPVLAETDAVDAARKGHVRIDIVEGKARRRGRDGRVVVHQQELRRGPVVGDPHGADLSVRPWPADDPLDDLGTVANLVGRPGAVKRSKQRPRTRLVEHLAIFSDPVGKDVTAEIGPGVPVLAEE